MQVTRQFKNDKFKATVTDESYQVQSRNVVRGKRCYRRDLVMKTALVSQPYQLQNHRVAKKAFSTLARFFLHNYPHSPTFLGDRDDGPRFQDYLRQGKTLTAHDFNGCECKGKGQQVTPLVPFTIL